MGGSFIEMDVNIVCIFFLFIVLLIFRGLNNFGGKYLNFFDRIKLPLLIVYIFFELLFLEGYFMAVRIILVGQVISLLNCRNKN